MLQAVYTIGLSLQDNRVTYGSYIYPSWGVVLGMSIGVVSLFPLPILAAIAIYYEEGPIIQVTRAYERPRPTGQGQ